MLQARYSGLIFTPQLRLVATFQANTLEESPTTRRLSLYPGENAKS